MECIKPAYYDRFRCLAGDCPDSCCHLWQVDIDPDTARRYQELQGPLGLLLRDFLRRDDSGFYLENVEDRCPAWREDGLCIVQAELGEEALSHVCRCFPRLRQDYGSFVELGLEISCPEAARLILNEDDALLCSILPDGGAGDYDADTMAILQRTRPELLEILADHSLALPQALAVALLYAYHVQGLIDGMPPAAFVPSQALALAYELALPDESTAPEELLLELEILTDEWRELLERRQGNGWFEQLRRFARYGVLRYFYQAVSDGDVAARMKMVILSCLLIARIAPAEKRLRVMQLYGKEIENDLENVEALLEAAYTHPAMTDRALLGWLLT